MRDVGNGIIDLPFVERTARPICKSRAFVELNAHPQIDKVRIADLFTLTERHGRDLGVEHGVGRFARQVEEDFNVLPTGMKDFQDVVICAEQIEHWREVQPLRLWVNRRRLMRVRQLHKAQIRIIRVFPHKFGINRNKWGFCKACAQFGEAFAIGDEWMNLHCASP